MAVDDTLASTVRFADGTACRLAADVLEELRDLIVFAGHVGRAYGDHQAIRVREAQTDEKATAIRADLQRFFRQSKAAMRTSAEASIWPEVRQHIETAIADLARSVDRWQSQASRSTQRARRNLEGIERDIAATMRAELCGYISASVRGSAQVAVVRQLANGSHVDSLSVEVADALRVDLRVEPSAAQPSRIRAFAKRIVVHAGTRRSFFGREKPATLRLDDLYIVEAVLSAAAIDLRLAPKLRGDPDYVLVRMREEHGEVRARMTLGDDRHEQCTADDAAPLRRLWDALQAERHRVAALPASVTQIELDGKLATDPRGYFECAERLVSRWRPAVSTLAEHTPREGELCIRVLQTNGPDEERWVRIADLTQHLLTIPAALRARLAPRELLGPSEVTVESDVIELGKIVTPDAGGDSDVIALEYIPPNETASSEQASGVPAALALVSDTARALTLETDPEENSGCYELSKQAR